MNGGGNAVAIPANAENKAAAIVFIHWLTSAQTQTKFNTDFGSAPVNANADDSSALVPNWQRVNQRDWMNDGFFKKKLLNGFMENVVQK
jgi:putative spermidine/putrescine transport system substrate-binding protein